MRVYGLASYFKVSDDHYYKKELYAATVRTLRSV